MIGATSRGLPLDMLYEMTPGQIVDYCVEYNNIYSEDSENEETIAKQCDFDSF